MKKISILIVVVLCFVSSANAGMFDDFIDSAKTKLGGLQSTLIPKTEPAPIKPIKKISIKYENNLSDTYGIEKVFEILTSKRYPLIQDFNCTDENIKANIATGKELACITPDMFSFDKEKNIVINTPLPWKNAANVLPYILRPMTKYYLSYYLDVNSSNPKKNIIKNTYKNCIDKNFIANGLKINGYEVVSADLADANITVSMISCTGLKEYIVGNNNLNPNAYAIVNGELKKYKHEEAKSKGTAGGAIVEGAGVGYASAPSSASGDVATLAIMGVGAVMWGLEKAFTASDKTLEKERLANINNERFLLSYNYTININSKGDNNEVMTGYPLSDGFGQPVQHKISITAANNLIVRIIQDLKKK